MSGFSGELPRSICSDRARTDLLEFLQDARRRRHEVVVISEGSSLFSGPQKCPGSLAVFGASAIHDVLSDSDTFGAPTPMAKRFMLPNRLARLTSGIFSMGGAEHRRNRLFMMPSFTKDAIGRYGTAVGEGCAAFLRTIRHGQVISLLSEMHRLALHVSCRIVFGASQLELGSKLQRYFHMRRELSTSEQMGDIVLRRSLVGLGSEIDTSLRSLARQLRATGERVGDNRCLFENLSARGTSDAGLLSEDELISCGSTLFMSSTEPVAVSLTWLFLCLSQCKELRVAIRDEIGRVFGGCLPQTGVLAEDVPLLASVVREVLRLFPANAIMCRIAQKPGVIRGWPVPPGSEIVISPFAEHRNPDVYARPSSFLPERWDGFSPPKYSYFPFGGGDKLCLGRTLAEGVLLYAAALLNDRYDFVLHGDQAVDWTVNITLMPSSDPTMMLFEPARSSRRVPEGRLRGRVASLANFRGSRPT